MSTIPEPVRVRMADAVMTISTAVIATASRGLLRPTMPMTTATTTRVTPMPTVSAVLSCSPKVRMANSFNHSGVNWMNVWPSEFNGDDETLKTPIHSPKAAINSAMPMASPIAVSYTHLRAHETDSYLV